MNNKKRNVLFSGLAIIYLVSCQQVSLKNERNFDSAINTNSGHLQKPVQNTQDIPPLANTALPLAKPEKLESIKRYTVVVNDVPISEILFSLARDASLNLDVANNVDGNITINAVNQPLEAILSRIADNSDIIYEIKNDVLKIRKDIPFLKRYAIDYINMDRSSVSESTVATQISATGQGAGAESSESSGNNSSTQVSNSSENQFWTSIESNIRSIIGASTEGEQNTDAIIVNKETGFIAVMANSKQHQVIDEFISEIMFSSKRQVLIEATIAEVTLSDGFQAGIDWSFVGDQLASSSSVITQSFSDIALFDRPSFNLTHSANSSSDSIQTTLSALQTFGDVRIMSSPKIMALNNQTALLKVVDNLVYFTVDVSIETSDDPGTPGVATYETQIQTVPVGFVMSVTPFISDSKQVTLNVRPTISRVIGQARDPNPSLADVGVISEIPIIQVREVESVLNVASGDIAVMGGLMQDEMSKSDRGIPVISRIPILGNLFKYQNDTLKKTELVIFIRPTVIDKASVNDELDQFLQYLPENEVTQVGQ